MNVLQARFVDRFQVGYRPQGGKHFVLVALGDKAYALEWRAVDEMAADLRRRLEVPEQDAGHFTVTLAGTTWVLPRPLAWALRAALIAKARDAEEQEKAPAIAMDQALLMRSAAPVGLSSDPKIQDRAALEAAHDRDLRRFVPLRGIKSKEEFGRPTVLNRALTLEERLAGLDVRRLRKVLA